MQVPHLATYVLSCAVETVPFNKLRLNQPPISGFA